jgi:hypothetical protein
MTISADRTRDDSGELLSFQRILAASIVISVLICTHAFGKTAHFWLIGGGPDVYSTQVQIEANVLWALQTIEKIPGERRIHIYFTDGTAETPDVTEWAPVSEQPDRLQPLARVFNSYLSNGERYRNHRIPNVEGTTEASHLLEALAVHFRSLTPEDEGWLIFNGHGSYSKDLNNTIQLWNNTSLNVESLLRLLNQAPKVNRIRFLFTQCYAGAFARLAISEANRCGFVAEAADQEAEGCSSAIDASNYEDYSTHFFAALRGHPRNGKHLDINADFNGDDHISPLEAHYYTLVKANSSDIPRATSEVLLEKWRPWYRTALFMLVGEPDNVYSKLAHRLMERRGIDSASAPETEIRRRRHRLKSQRQIHKQNQQKIKQELDPLREAIKTQVLRRWPRAHFGYTLNFKRFLEEDLNNAQAFIIEHPDYAALKAKQLRYWELVDQLLENKRALTVLEKIEHLLYLAQAKAALEKYGPDDLYARYQTLIRCEAAPF